MLIGPLIGIGGATTAIIALGLGGSTPRAVMFGWPAIVIAWSLIVLMQEGTNRLNRKTIEWQGKVIRNQAEVIDRIFFEDIGGRE